MQRIFAFATVLGLFAAISCGPLYNPKKPYYKKPKNIYHEVVLIPLIVDADTLFINELRFFTQRSAKDASLMMYGTYGMWQEEANGKHQENISQNIWKEVELIPNNHYTVLTDGTEQYIEFFTSFLVIDSTQNDALSYKNPLRDSLINTISQMMDSFDFD